MFFLKILKTFFFSIPFFIFLTLLILIAGSALGFLANSFTLRTTDLEMVISLSVAGLFALICETVAVWHYWKVCSEREGALRSVRIIEKELKTLHKELAMAQERLSRATAFIEPREPEHRSKFFVKVHSFFQRSLPNDSTKLLITHEEEESQK